MKRVKNKLITTLLAVTMAFSLTACGISQDNLDSAVTPLSEQITTINATLTEMQTLDTTLDGYIDTLESKVTTLETDLTAVNTALESLEENSATKTALLETKTALESEINTIKADITALKAKDTELDDKITALQTALSTEITDTETWIEETFATKTACDNLKTEINTSIATLQTKMDGLEDSIDNLETTVYGLQQDIDDLKNRIDELEKVINCMASGTHTLEKYVDNGDKTHSPACENCGYVDITTKERHYDYIDENCKCSVCGKEHYLPLADEGLCYCDYCKKYIHDLDENCVCVICSCPIHTVDSTTGICSVCNTFGAAASITVEGEKTYYSIFDEAIAYANGKDGTVIVIENDCSAEYSYPYVGFTSGSVTVDLNGKTIDAVENYVLFTEGGSVTIRDSVGGGKTNGQLGGQEGSLIIESGKYARIDYGGNITITGGEFVLVTVRGEGTTKAVSGGSFEKIGVYKNFGTFADILEDGYCFYDSDGNVVDISNVELDGYYYYLYNVTVGAKQSNK